MYDKNRNLASNRNTLNHIRLICDVLNRKVTYLTEMIQSSLKYGCRGKRQSRFFEATLYTLTRVAYPDQESVARKRRCTLYNVFDIVLIRISLSHYNCMTDLVDIGHTIKHSMLLYVLMDWFYLIIIRFIQFRSFHGTFIFVDFIYCQPRPNHSNVMFIS